MRPHEATIPAIAGELIRLLEGLNVFAEGERIDPDVPLLEGGLGLDSIAVLEFISLIEQRYAISFPLDDLNTTVFSSLAAVARQVHAMLDPGVTASGGTDQGTGHAPGPATGAIS